MTGKSSFTISLPDVPKGRRVIIHVIPDPDIARQAIRLGIGESSSVKCLGRIALGPVVVTKGNREIALGYRLAKQIRVKLTRSIYD